MFQLETECVLILGSKNRPQDIDKATKKRFTSRIYIPLPDAETRKSLINFLQKVTNINDLKNHKINDMREEYISSDITSLLRKNAMIPLGELTML